MLHAIDRFERDGLHPPLTWRSAVVCVVRRGHVRGYPESTRWKVQEYSAGWRADGHWQHRAVERVVVAERGSDEEQQHETRTRI